MIQKQTQLTQKQIHFISSQPSCPPCTAYSSVPPSPPPKPPFPQRNFHTQACMPRSRASHRDSTPATKSSPKISKKRAWKPPFTHSDGLRVLRRGGWGCRIRFACGIVYLRIGVLRGRLVLLKGTMDSDFSRTSGLLFYCTHPDPKTAAEYKLIVEFIESNYLRVGFQRISRYYREDLWRI
jgi:hypothetical protein